MVDSVSPRRRSWLLALGVVLALAFGSLAALSRVADPVDPTGPPARTAPKTSPAPQHRKRDNGPLSPEYTDAKIERWIRQGKLPEAPSHGDVFLTMANTLWRDGPHDVVVFGDSMAQQGFDPQALSDAVEGSTGQPVRVFNAGSSRARWGVNRMLVRYAERHRVLPKVALLAITTRAAEDDAFYANDVSTRPFAAVTDGCADSRSAKRRAECERERSDLRFRFRGREDMMEAAAAGKQWPASMWVRDGVRLRSDGLLAHPSVTVRQVESDSRRRLEHAPGNPHVDEAAQAEFRETVEILRRNDVTVIAFSMPYTPVHQNNLESEYPGYDKRRTDAATELTASVQVPLFQVESFGAWWGDGDSRDAIHLSEAGGGSFVRQLWGMPGFADAIHGGLAQP